MSQLQYNTLINQYSIKIQILQSENMHEEFRDQIIDLGNETGLSLNHNKLNQEKPDLEYPAELKKLFNLQTTEQIIKFANQLQINRKSFVKKRVILNEFTNLDQQTYQQIQERIFDQIKHIKYHLNDQIKSISNNMQFQETFQKLRSTLSEILILQNNFARRRRNKKVKKIEPKSKVANLFRNKIVLQDGLKKPQVQKYTNISQQPSTLITLQGNIKSIRSHLISRKKQSWFWQFFSSCISSLYCWGHDTLNAKVNYRIKQQERQMIKEEDNQELAELLNQKKLQ